MPRLNKTDYLKRRSALQMVWREQCELYGVLPTRQQRLLHEYYQTQSCESDAPVLAERARLNGAKPSLPHQAGKAYRKLMAQQPCLGSGSPTDGVRQIRLIAVARPEPDIKALAAVLLEHARKEAGNPAN